LFAVVRIDVSLLANLAADLLVGDIMIRKR
jgi:hypothetical protein